MSETENLKVALPAPDGCFLPVVYEDSELLILHKSSGVHSLPLSPTETHSAVSAALAHVPTLAGVGRGGLEPGLLHRLDQGTSGLLVFAKNQLEYDRLRELWKKGGVQKVYRTWVGISPLAEPLTTFPKVIRTPLAHSAKSSKRMIAVTSKMLERQIRGKPLPAVTRIKACHRKGELMADLEIEIETGVMHQIRCHLASLGMPILGDTTYGKTTAKRLLLHAWRLALPLQSGVLLKLEAELPEEWREIRLRAE